MTGLTGCVGGAEPSEEMPAGSAVEQALEGTVLIEVGRTSPEMDLLIVRANHEVSIELAIEGAATFADGSTYQSIVAGPGDVVRLPAIQASDTADESFIQVKLDGIEQERQRIAVLPEGGIQKMKDAFAEMPGAILSVGEGFAVVDEGFVASEASAVGSSVGVMFVDEDQTVPLGLCIREAWGPGKVKWSFSNPSGSGYSSKPESSNNLVWAAAPEQATDGIYRRSWGCGNAYKIPDSCTATVNSSGSISYCCNLAMQQLGHVCQWVNPGAIGWPNCPL
ncbi:hypothetical protein [Polyangium spumosum]|uniref:Uncharacterized protein n=1 Tax=Polyangium spumosum TaxID=889282 RepID=A0A6N7PX34_9BACT|nr:hypothetical protein [Polyangium spumosum]MRG96077.1 hypothetical protein [Polyangium spumosum]